MTRVTFLSALSAARKGEKIIYHTGWLMTDRRFGPTFDRVHAVATAAMEAWNDARVHLVQRRLGPNVYEYIAVKR